MEVIDLTRDDSTYSEDDSVPFPAALSLPHLQEDKADMESDLEEAGGNIIDLLLSTLPSSQNQDVTPEITNPQNDCGSSGKQDSGPCAALRDASACIDRGSIGTRRSTLPDRISRSTAAGKSDMTQKRSAQVMIAESRSQETNSGKTAMQKPLWEVGQTPDRFKFTHTFSLRSSSGSSNVSIEDNFLVTYTCSLSSLTAWLDDLPYEALLGFDTEGGGAIVQLCSLGTSKILIFSVPEVADQQYRSACSAALSNVIGSSRYLKVGVAAFEDALKLNRSYDIKTRAIFDLGFLSRDLQISKTGEVTRTFEAEQQKGVLVINEGNPVSLSAGLKNLFKSMFVSRFEQLEPVPKDTYADPSVYVPRYHRWSHYPIASSDLLYAAKDSVFGCMLYNAMIIKYTEDESRVLWRLAAAEYEKRYLRSLKRGSFDMRQVKKVAAPTALVPETRLAKSKPPSAASCPSDDLDSPVRKRKKFVKEQARLNNAIKRLKAERKALEEAYMGKLHK